MGNINVSEKFLFEDEYIAGLKKRIIELEEENTRLKSELNAFMINKRNSNKIDYSALVSFWNNKMEHKAVPSISKIVEGSKRRIAVIARCKEYGKKAIFDVINNVAESDFLNGNNNRNFIATFDWVFSPTNFPKVLEGNYKNKSNGKEKSGRMAEVPDKFIPLWGEVSD